VKNRVLILILQILLVGSDELNNAEKKYSYGLFIWIPADLALPDNHSRSAGSGQHSSSGSPKKTAVPT